MRNALIFLVLICNAYWVNGYPRSNPYNEVQKRTITKGKSVMSSIPAAEKEILVQKFRSLCSFKPIEETGNGWTRSIKRSILDKVEKTADTEEDKFVKTFLVESIVDSVVLECGKKPTKIVKQDDNEDIYSGLESILKNVFSGNIFGIVQSSVGIRTPDEVSNMVSEVLRTLLGNISSAQQAISAGTANSGNAANAVAGATTNTGTAAVAG